MTRDLPEKLQQKLNSPPKAGEGVHNWLYVMALQLHEYRGVNEIYDMLADAVANCGRRVTKMEIEQAVHRSRKDWKPRIYAGGNYSSVSAPKWPQKDLKRIETICTEGYGLADLWESSPVRIDDSKTHTEEIIDQLFPGDPLLCCGWANDSFDTKPRSEWRGELAQLQFIVPSPMTDRTGLTKEGKESKHCFNNTGPRRFLVVECDFSIYAPDGQTETDAAPLIRKLNRAGSEVADTVADMGAAVLLHLARYVPMICALHSGGKSLHGWFFVEGEPEETVRKFFRYAVSIGADKQMWTKSQFVRMPDGTRYNEDGTTKPQTVYFLNLKPIKG